MPVKLNYSGLTFGRITLSTPVPGKTGYWKGQCACGNPVEKRIDNLKRPGEHSCGKCPLLIVGPDTPLEARVHRLEEIVTMFNPELVESTLSSQQNVRALTPLTASEMRDEPLVPMPQPMDGHASRVARADVAPGPITAGEPIETGEVVTDQIRPQSFPLPKGHAFYHYFYYREDPDGLELESTMSGEVEFLGFCSSITEVRRAIMKYLYKRGNTEELVKSIWPKSDLV